VRPTRRRSPASAVRSWESTATIANGEPTALEHSDLRWLTEAELFDVPWLPADLGVLQAIRVHLKES
jgi:8-oxo-dGTP diphosphatase